PLIDRRRTAGFIWCSGTVVLCMILFSLHRAVALLVRHPVATRRSSDLAIRSGRVGEEGGVDFVGALRDRDGLEAAQDRPDRAALDRKSTRLNSSHVSISYAVFCLKKKKNN